MGLLLSRGSNKYLKLALIASISWAASAKSIYAGECASPGRDGSGIISGVVNAYWVGDSNPSAGATSFQLGPATGAATPIAAGDLLVFMQMQDARINTSDTGNYGDNQAGDPAQGYTNIRRAGRFEFARATSAVPMSGGTLTLSTPITYDYTSANPSANFGQRSFQIIRVPQYLDATISGTITAEPWNGSQGGVVIIDVANTLTFAGGTIDVSERGFRGGGGRGSTTGSGSNTAYRTPFSNGAHGAKGESYAGTPRLVWNGVGVTNLGIDGYPNGDFARGAPANGGGGGTDEQPSNNSRNTGGGGGAGAGAGGQGGYAWCPGGPSVCGQTGGLGGKGTAVLDSSRLTLGGGGGAGTTNNATGTPANGVASSGATGGGIVIIRSGTLTGSGTIRADGEDANATVDNDGSGGGGGGGSVLLSAQDSTGLSLVASAHGGDGGTNGNSTPHGPGGGGGGGFIGRTAAVTGLTTDISPGDPGVTDGNTSPFTQNYGAEAGEDGEVVSATATSIPGFSSGEECRVDISKSFTPDISAPNTPVQLSLSLTNPNPTLPMSALAITDLLPTNVEIAPTPNQSTTCSGGTLTAPANGSSVSLTGATLPPLASCEVLVDVIGTGPGTFNNIIPLGNATADINGTSVENTLAATDDLSITAPLIGTKSVDIIATPDNPDAYALPGAITEYTISFENPASSTGAADDIVLVDALPSELIFLGDDIAGPGSGPALFVDGSPSTTLTPVFEYSADGGATFTHSPSLGQDTNVTHIRFVPTGSMPAGSSGEIKFRAIIQ